MGLLDDAGAGRLTEEMKIVAKAEDKTPEFILRGIACGRIVIPRSPYRYTRPVGIGKGLRTKVNASIGTSSDIVDVEMEVAKARVAEANGADTLMELSTGGDFREIRRHVIEATELSVGSVPFYQAFIEAIIHGYSHTDINSICIERLRRQGERYGGVCTMCGDYCALKIKKESIDLAR